MTARVVVAGASGQVGTELLRASAPAGWTVLQPTRHILDLNRPGEVLGVMDALAPDAIINAAAYTAVDQAESSPDAAFALNRDAPASLAQAAATLGAALIHISTDYVFSGDKPSPYVETDPVAPHSVYGRSKVEGERAVCDACANAAIVRTSWIYSPHRTNFLKTMLRLGETRDEVAVVADQIGRPTAAKDLAAACIAMTERLLAGDERARGVFHYAGAGDASWADFAEEIFAVAAERGRNPVRVNRIATAEYPTPARRPANSRLDTSKIEALGVRTRPWREGVRDCVNELLACEIRTARQDP